MLWNSLPPEAKKTSWLYQFKRSMSTIPWLGFEGFFFGGGVVCVLYLLRLEMQALYKRREYL